LAAADEAALQSNATLLALAIALLWTLHPLQTESVTYVVQRTESLMGLCYLLTLYAFVRGAESPRPNRWYALTIAACLAGMASKEVMVSAPLLVLLYDRTFVSGSLREAWRRRRGLYAGLAATWLVLAWLVIATGSRGGTAGFGAGVAWWAYALSQFHAIAHYLRLAVWPHPLVLDYGAPLARYASEVLPYGLLVVALVAATVVALRRRPALGFAGCWFFAILAPTSSVVPVATQTMAEHRMYLPLAAVVAIAVLGLHALAGRRARPVFVALAAGLGFLTWQRNADYRSELVIWSDTAAKCPANPRAHFTLGNVLSRLDRLPEAGRQYEDVLRLDPRHAEAHNSLGNVLVRMNRPAEALAHYARALELEPDYVEAEYNWGNTLVQLDRLPEATPHYEHALRLDPDNAEVRNNFGNALLLAGRAPEAIRQYEAALRIKPTAAEAHYNLGNALVRAGRLPEAIRQYEEALRLKPDYGEAQANLVQTRALQPATPPP
jgi:Tfp pilus assembly protein PilF